MSNKIVITGDRGFIGTNLQALTGWDGIDLPAVDIRSLTQVRKALEPYDTVIHLAGLAGVSASVENEAAYVDTNINGTYNVAQVCYRLNKRLIFASSSSVYQCRSPYADTKKGAEEIIQAFTRHGLDSCILRFFTVIGEHNRKDMAAYKFTQAIDEGEPIDLYGDCWRDFTYVQDLCSIIQKVVKVGTKGTWDAGFGDPIQVMSLITMLENVIGKTAEVRQKEQRACDPKITKSSPQLVYHLGIKPTPIKQAVRNTAQHILARDLPDKF